MKKLIIALALTAAAATPAIAQSAGPTGSTTATSINRMDVSSTTDIFGAYNTKLSTQYNTQDAFAEAQSFGHEGDADSTASNLLIDRQVDMVTGEYNLVTADDGNYQGAYAFAEGHSWGQPAEALTVNELADEDNRFVEGYGNMDLREKYNEQFGESVAIAEPAAAPSPWGKPVIVKPVCTSHGCVR